MSEPSPHSIPLSSPSHPHYRPPPQKKRPLSPTSAQSAQISTLFKKPDRVITVAGPRPKTLPPPPEIVANVQGSSAGAGSGEFHVYKASRRRENERVKMMDDELRKEKEKEEFNRKQEEMRKRDEEKTDRNRKRRDKKRNKLLRSNAAPAGGGAASGAGNGRKGGAGGGGGGGGGGMKMVGNGKKARMEASGADSDSAEEEHAPDNAGLGLVIHDEDL